MVPYPQRAFTCQTSVSFPSVLELVGISVKSPHVPNLKPTHSIPIFLLTRNAPHLNFAQNFHPQPPYQSQRFRLHIHMQNPVKFEASPEGLPTRPPRELRVQIITIPGRVGKPRYWTVNLPQSGTPPPLPRRTNSSRSRPTCFCGYLPPFPCLSRPSSLSITWENINMSKPHQQTKLNPRAATLGAVAVGLTHRFFFFRADGWNWGVEDSMVGGSMNLF